MFCRKEHRLTIYLQLLPWRCLLLQNHSIFSHVNGSRLKQQTSHYKRKQSKYNYVSKDREKPRQHLFWVFRRPAHGRQRGLVYQVIPNLNAQSMNPKGRSSSNLVWDNEFFLFLCIIRLKWIYIFLSLRMVLKCKLILLTQTQSK